MWVFKWRAGHGGSRFLSPWMGIGERKMVGIQGIGEIPEPANSRQVQGRSKSSDSTPARATDGVRISEAAVKATEVADLVARTVDQSGLRHERIEQAKRNIEQGTYRIQEIVLRVADRLAQLVE